MNPITNIHLVRHVIEPERLMLAWQPLELSKDRIRRIVGKLIRSGEEVIFRYLVDTTDFEEAKKNGFECYPAFRKPKQTYRGDVLSIFMLRLPPRKRADFAEYLMALRMPSELNISDFALLGYSEARLPSDGFSIVHPFDSAPSPCEFLTEVAGFRHYKKPDEVYLGARLSFEIDRDNRYDEGAVKILFQNDLIGYVNRGQKKAFSTWLANNTINAYIEKINGSPNKLRVMMFVEVA